MTVNYTKLASLQPFLLRAFYQWSVEQGLSAQILVYIDPNSEEIRVPKKHLDAKETNLVFNLSPQSISDLEISDKSLSFNARFNREAHFIYIPIHLVELIFLKENINIGMTFDCNEEIENSPFSSDDLAMENEIGNLEWLDFASYADLDPSLKECSANLYQQNQGTQNNLATAPNARLKLLKPINQEDIKFILV